MIALGTCAILAWLRFTSVPDTSSFSRLRRPPGSSNTVTLYRHRMAAAAAAAADDVVEAGGAMQATDSDAILSRTALATASAIQHAASTGERVHELHVVVPPPAVLAPVLAAEKPVDAPAQCHARAHTELDGGVVRWGTDHKLSSAAECCEACTRHAAAAASPNVACNVWVYCADAALCGEKSGQCWLKHTSDPTEPNSRGGGASVPWTSGTVFSAPADSYKVERRMRRASRQRADLTVLDSAEFVVGLRNETGTIELLTPHQPYHQPHFSFPLPLTDSEVRLGGRGEYLDRRADGFHHLGDLTLRASSGRSPEVTCSTVRSGGVAASASASRTGAAAGAAGGKLDVSHDGSWSLARDVAIGVSRSSSGARCPVSVMRTLRSSRAGLDLTFELHNPSDDTVTLGALGLSMPFDQDFVGRQLTQVAHQCSFVEPFLGLGGGYVQVTRATGVGPVLLLLPLAGTEFEAWRPLRNGEDLMRLDFMYEISHELA